TVVRDPGTPTNCQPRDDGPIGASAVAFPSAIAVDDAGDIYVSEPCRIREVRGDVIATVAGVQGVVRASGKGLPGGLACGPAAQDGGAATSGAVSGNLAMAAT